MPAATAVDWVGGQVRCRAGDPLLAAVYRLLDGQPAFLKTGGTSRTKHPAM
jgi:hypothetical protein